MNEPLILMTKPLFRDLGSRQRPGVRRSSGAVERLTAFGKLQRAGALQDAPARSHTAFHDTPECKRRTRGPRQLLECASPLALSSGHEIFDLEKHSERKVMMRFVVGSEFATSAESSRGLEHSRTLPRFLMPDCMVTAKQKIAAVGCTAAIGNAARIKRRGRKLCERRGRRSPLRLPRRSRPF